MQIRAIIDVKACKLITHYWTKLQIATTRITPCQVKSFLYT